MSEKLIFQSSNDVFTSFKKLIRNTGEPFSDTKALFNVSFEIIDPTDWIIIDPERKWSSSYAKREWEWYQSGDRSVAEIKKHAPIWDKMHDGNNKVWSNYGWWWKKNGQLARIIWFLRHDPNTRRAVLVHYDPNEMHKFEKDTPCNLVLNFWILNGKLNLTIFARSIDLWYGFCNDQFCFAKLMENVASKTNTEIGSMHWFITNLHLYNYIL